MRWTPGGSSDDIEDRRDEDSGGGGGYGGGGFGFGGMHLGLGGVVILFVLSLLFRTNFFAMLGGGAVAPHPAPVSRPNPARDEAEKPLVQFVAFVLNDTQKTWDAELPKQAGVPYHHAKLVLFRNSTFSGCGGARSSTGPFYCPTDEKVYIDLSFYDELKQRFGAPGEFAQAYVLAHEIGHHVQKIIGVEGKVRQLQSEDPKEANPLSVDLELQADCFAGVWAHSSRDRGLLDPGDVPAALRAAAAVGDDHIQQMTRGRVQPETFTHGSSEQRVEWFNKGLESGLITSCNTFGK
jgi:uncharacterized protein